MVKNNLYGKNTFISEVGYGYNNNVNEDKESISSSFARYSVYEEYIFDSIPLNFTLLGEIKSFNKLHNNYTLNNELGYKIKKFKFQLGDIFYSDKNDLQNSFNGVYFKVAFSIKEFTVSYNLTRKYYTSKYDYGNFKGFFKNMQISKMKNKKQKVFPHKILQFLNSRVSKHETDYMHTFTILYSNDYFSILPNITYNKSNINIEEFFSSSIDIEYNFIINRNLALSMYLSPKYIKYTHFDRKDFLTDSGFNTTYYFSDNFYLGIEIGYKYNNSTVTDEDFENLTSSFFIGINF